MTWHDEYMTYSTSSLNVRNVPAGHNRASSQEASASTLLKLLWPGRLRFARGFPDSLGLHMSTFDMYKTKEKSVYICICIIYIYMYIHILCMYMSIYCIYLYTYPCCIINVCYCLSLFLSLYIHVICPCWSAILFLAKDMRVSPGDNGLRHSGHSGGLSADCQIVLCLMVLNDFASSSPAQAIVIDCVRCCVRHRLNNIYRLKQIETN